MKRLLSILLALALLACPLGALADAAKYTLRFQMTQEELQAAMADPQYVQLMSELMGEAALPEMDDTIAALSTSLLNATSFEATVQDNGLQLALCLGTTELADLCIVYENGEIAVTSSVLPDLMLCASVKELEEALASVDWATLAQLAEEEAFSWLMMRGQAYETGSYASAAFDDAVEIVRFEIDDADIALLVEGLLLRLEEEQALVDVVDQLLGENSMRQFIHEARKFNYSAATLNSYDYVLTLAYTADDMPAGITLACSKAGEQIWHASAALNDTELQVIVGVAANGGMNYFAYTVGMAFGPDGATVSAQEFAIYQAEADESYDEAASSDDALLCLQAITSTRTQGTEDAYESNSESTLITLQRGVQTQVQKSQQTQTYQAEPFAWTLRDTVSINGVPNGTLLLEGKACEPFALDISDKTVRIDETTDEMQALQLLSDALAQGEKLLQARLIKGLPADVLQLFIQQMMGQ